MQVARRGARQRPVAGHLAQISQRVLERSGIEGGRSGSNTAHHRGKPVRRSTLRAFGPRIVPTTCSVEFIAAQRTQDKTRSVVKSLRVTELGSVISALRSVEETSVCTEQPIIGSLHAENPRVRKPPAGTVADDPTRAKRIARRESSRQKTTGWYRSRRPHPRKAKPASMVALKRAPTMTFNRGGYRSHRDGKSQARAKLADKGNPDECQPAQGEQRVERKHEQRRAKRREEKRQGEQRPNERDAHERGPNPEQRAKDSWRKSKDMIQKMISKRVGRARRTRTVSNVVTDLRTRGRQSRNERTEREPRAKRVGDRPKLAPRKKEGPRSSEGEGIDTQDTQERQSGSTHDARQERTAGGQRTHCKDNVGPRTPPTNHALEDIGWGITVNVEHEHRIGKRAGMHSADDLRVSAKASLELKRGEPRIG